MSITTPINPKAWQDQHTEKQAHVKSLNKVSRLLIPVLIGMLAPLLYVIIYAGNLFDEVTTTGALIYRITQSVILFVLVIIFTFLGIGYLFKTASEFSGKLHNLPANDASELTRLRVLGIPLLPPPMCNWFKFPEVSVKDKKLDKPDHWSIIVGGPAKLNISVGHALYLERGIHFSRIVGQGTAFLEWNERISAAVNVGPHNETLSVTAWTKEGIKVIINAKGEYFLGHARNEDEENVLIPYDPEAIYKAVQYTTKSGKEANEWLKSATGQTQGILSTYISNSYLDELFLKDNNKNTLLSGKNMEELLNTINSKLQDYGVYLSNFQITDVILPPKVKTQRLKTWKTAHENILVMADGELKAHEIRLREQVRAEIQRDLIFTLANGLDRIDSSNFPEPLLLSISTLLDQSMKDPMVRANLAKESLETLEKLQGAIKVPLQLSGEDS